MSMQKLVLTLRENKKIAAFLSGQAVSLFGSSLVQYALMWHIVRETDSGASIALYNLCAFAPNILIALFGGAWADRYSRKKLIIYADLGIAAATLLLGILMAFRDFGYLPIFLITIIRALGGGIQSPAVSAVLPQIVEEDKLLRVNSINSTINSIIMFLSPAAARLILGVLPLFAVLLVDVFTALIAVLILFFLKIPMHERAETSNAGSLLRDVRSGWRYTMGQFFLRRLMSYSFAFNFLVTPAALFTPLLVSRIYGGSDTYLMFNEMFFFIGGLVGGISLSAWGGFKNRIATLALGGTLAGLCIAALGLQLPFWVYLLFMFLTGITLPSLNVPMIALLQEKVQPDMMGRVFSLNQTASGIVLMSANLLFGFLSDRTPIGTLLLACGAMMTLLSAVGITLDKRFLREGLPKSSQPSG